MKKIVIVSILMVIFATFSSIAEAEGANGESVSNLVSINVTFRLEPLQIWAELNGDRIDGPLEVAEGDMLDIEIISQDRDSSGMSLHPGVLPEGASYTPNPLQTLNFPEKRGRFTWIPQSGKAQEAAYEVYFRAENVEGEIAELVLSIVVVEGDEIAIELRPATWDIDVELGEIVRDSDTGQTHTVENIGTVTVRIDVGYALPDESGTDYGPIHPGWVQDVDQFITMIGDTVIPPPSATSLNDDSDSRRRVVLDKEILVGATEILSFGYGAPIGLSQHTYGNGTTPQHRIVLDVKAYQELPRNLL